jgi:hypothetical protein
LSGTLVSIYPGAPEGSGKRFRRDTFFLGIDGNRQAGNFQKDVSG